MNRPANDGLLRPAMAALKWNYLGVAARTGSSFIIGIVLARLLGPKPFGEVAIAWLVIGLGNLMADCGFGAALVQRKEFSREDIRFVFTAQVGLGVFLTAIVAVAAPGIASIFRQPEVTPIIRAVALVFALQAFGLTAQSLLKRDLAFRNLQAAQVISYLVGYLGLGIPLACFGYGVWSLVGAQLMQTLINSALLYLATRHPIRPKIAHPHRELTSFGGKVIGVNLANWAISNFDTGIVGRMFGAASLGLYNRSTALMLRPTNAVVAALQSVLFPVYSRAQGKPDTLRRGHLTSIAAIAIFFFPVFFTIAVIPRTVILGLYGNRWIAAATLVAPIAMARPFQASMAMAGPLLWGLGRVERELRVQIVIAAIMIPALLIASRYSLVAISWTLFGIMVLESVLMNRPALEATGVSWRDVGRVTRGAFLLSAVLAAGIWTLDHAVLVSLASSFRLMADAGTAAVVSIALLRLRPGMFLCDELIYLVRQGSTPVWVRSFLLKREDSGVETPA